MTESPDYTDDSQSRSIAQWMRHSTTFKLVFIGLLALFLMYPVGLVDDLVSEREQARGQVVNEISQKWGNDQTLVGPLLTIPVDIRHKIDKGDETRIRTERIRAHFLPNELDSAPSGSSRSSRS